MKHLFITFLFSLSLLTTFTPTVGLAQDATTNDQNIGAETQFVPLVGIPFMDMGADLNLDNYVNNLYRAAITIAALLAVIRIIFAGFQYMLSDIVTQKTDARKSIKNALLGLLIVIGAVLILETINPNLIRVPILGGEGGLQGFIGDLGAVPVGVSTPTYNIGDEADMATTDLEQFKKGCNGQTSIVIENNKRVLTCTSKTDSTSDELKTYLTDNTGLTPSEINDVVNDYNRLVVSNTNFSDQELADFATNTNGQLFDYLNKTAGTEISDRIAAGEDATSAIVAYVRDKSFFIQNSENQTSDDLAATSRLCERMTGTVVALDKNHTACMR